jgi:tetratricopeptide (TPR) repeat protein
MAAATDAKAIADRIQVPTLIFGATFVIGMIHHEIGNFAEALDTHEQCLRLETPEIDQKRAGWAAYPSVMVRAFLTVTLIELGDLERASAVAEEARQRAEATNDVYSRATINHVLGRLLTILGRPDEAIALLMRSWHESLEREMVQMYPILAARLGEAYLAAGDVDAAIEITSAPEKLDVPLAEHTWGWRYLFIAEGRAMLAAGRAADAHAAAELALALAQERGEPPHQAHALKLLGDIAATTGAPSEAGDYYRRAYELAQQCGMKPVMAQCDEARARLATPRLHAG